VQRTGIREEDLVGDSRARTPFGAFARARDRVMMGPAAAYAVDTRAALEREAVEALASGEPLEPVTTTRRERATHLHERARRGS
jgi:hypothetical protein